MKNSMMTDKENTDFFFWLGQDGEAFELSEEEFNYQVEKARKKKEDWLNVTVEDGEGWGD